MSQLENETRIAYVFCSTRILSHIRTPNTPITIKTYERLHDIYPRMRKKIIDMSVILGTSLFRSADHKVATHILSYG